jgi:hypothetical protein
MKTFARIFVIVSILVVASGCGTDSGNDDSAAPQNAASTPSASSTTDSADEESGAGVVSVALHRTGGLKPITVNRVFAADAKPPAGFDAADVDAVLAAASRFSDADVQVSPVPMDTCCDRYTYEVTISYADGTSKSFSTIDGLQQPRIFQQLLQAVS